MIQTFSPMERSYCESTRVLNSSVRRLVWRSPLRDDPDLLAGREVVLGEDAAAKPQRAPIGLPVLGAEVPEVAGLVTGEQFLRGDERLRQPRRLLLDTSHLLLKTSDLFPQALDLGRLGVHRSTLQREVLQLNVESPVSLAALRAPVGTASGRSSSPPSPLTR
jgi:hypothetical protein